MVTLTATAIVPAYNAGPYLAEALRSIAGQQAPPLEVLVVDGGSTDGSLAAVAAYPGARVIRQQGRGLADARNEGLAAARGDLIAFLDADDLWTPDRLAVQAACLAHHPDCVAVAGHLVRFLQPGTPLPPAYAGGWLDHPEPGYTPGALLARRAIFDRVGGFDTALAVGCDTDWFARARDAGAAPAMLPQVVLRKRIHGANLSAQVALYRRELLILARRSLVRRGIIGDTQIWDPL